MFKKSATVLLLAFCVSASQPAPAYAGFFLFNIINDVFGGGHKNSGSSTQSQSSNISITALKLGMRNSQVADMQKYLIKAKYLGGKADGVFGYQTQQAVKMFQRDCGLVEDGIVGKKTMNALKNFKGTRPKTSPLPRKPTYNPPKKDSGVPEYLYALPMLVTAYTRYDQDCTDYTYMGTYLRRGLCAVDPDVIPLGTKLYVPGYGEAIADDIGGAINGKHIDLAMDTQDEAFEWGKRNVTVYVLKT